MYICTYVRAAKYGLIEVRKSSSISDKHIIKAWWDCSATSQLRTFSGRIPNPFKRRFAPLRSIPGGNEPARIQPDIMHCMNLGFGKDLCASSILLLCRFDCFNGASIGKKLENAYEDFRLWCGQNNRTSSLKCFTLKTCKIQSQLLWSGLKCKILRSLNKVSLRSLHKSRTGRKPDSLSKSRP